MAYVGGWFWTGLVTAAAIGLYVEWLTVIGARKPRLVRCCGVLILFAVGWVNVGRINETYLSALVVLGVLAVAILSSDLRLWTAVGLGYALAASIGSSAVRLDPIWGFRSVDAGAAGGLGDRYRRYFAGRLIGGPKLWPQVSPKKTWAGALGGFAASLGVAAGFAAFNFGKIIPLLLLGAVLSIASQLGDLFESAVKRRFGVKDSSHIIPGHGGLMDRLDGFVAAIVLAAVFGFLRGGADGVGRGLMVW